MAQASPAERPGEPAGVEPGNVARSQPSGGALVCVTFRPGPPGAVAEGRFGARKGPFCVQKSIKIAKNRSGFWGIFVDDKGVTVVFAVSECIKSLPCPVGGGRSDRE